MNLCVFLVIYRFYVLGARVGGQVSEIGLLW